MMFNILLAIAVVGFALTAWAIWTDDTTPPPPGDDDDYSASSFK